MIASYKNTLSSIFTTADTMYFNRRFIEFFGQATNNLKGITRQLVILRHGANQWNDSNRWAGWTDVKLSEKGVEEARKAGQQLKEAGFLPDVAYTSLMSRTIQTFNHIVDELDCLYVPLYKTWRLNEKHYGALQGINRSDATDKYGEKQVKIWRRSYDVAPPALDKQDPRHPIHDPRYKDIDPKLLPATESLKDTIARMKPVLDNDILPQIKEGKNVLVVGHGNTIRSILKVLRNISDEDIVQVNIPTGIPLIYEFSEKGQVISNRFLGNPEEFKRRAEEVKNMARKRTPDMH